MVRNEDILKDILLKMNYDPSKTLNENIQEQGAADRLVDMRAMGSAQEYANYKQQQFDANNKAIDDMIEFFKDPHNVLMAIEIGAMYIAPFTGPFAPVFAALSIGAGLADSAVYYFVDDDPHSAWIALGLTLIPQAKVGKYLKRSNWYIRKYGQTGVDELLEKYNKYKKGNKSIKFTDEETKFLKEVGEDLAEETTQAVIKQELKAGVKKGILTIGAEKTVKGLLALVWNTAKFTGKSLKEIGKMGLMVGGIYVTFDQLFVPLHIGTEADRQKSEFKQVADLVVNFSAEIKEWLISILNQLIGGSTILEDEEEYKRYEDTVLAVDEPIQSADEYMAAKERAYQERQANLPGKKVTLDNIRRGKEDLHYGDQGPMVKKIQQMLINLGLDVGDKGADGFFGDDTKDAVIDFQMYPDEYGLSDSVMLNKQDGVVGKETLNAIERALKKKKK